MPIAFDGLVVPSGGQYVLVYGPDAGAFGEPRFGSPAYLAPGYRPFAGGDDLVISEVIDDRGQRFRDAQAIAWIEQRGDQFPRADAVGYRASGQTESMFIKALDLADLRVYASPTPSGLPVVRLSAAIEARAVEDGLALSPIDCPPALALWTRALPAYRLAPGIFGAVGTYIAQQLVSTGRRDWRLSFDEIDDLVGG